MTIVLCSGMEEVDPYTDDITFVIFKVFPHQMQQLKFISVEQFYHIYEKVLHENSIHSFTKTVRDECSICLEREPDVALTCGHHFCDPCISDWTKRESNCPLCRRIITEKYVDVNPLSRSEITQIVMDFIDQI